LEEIYRSKAPATIEGKLFVRDSPRSREAEAFRSLRTNLTFANVDKRPRSFLVTSALPSEGKSVVSANLALAFAEDGIPTVLVDADLRRPSQHALFGLSVREGLTSLLTGELPLDGLQRFRVGARLLVIPAGSLPPNPAELLSSEKMTTLVQQLTGLAENCVVVIDTSPVLAVADPLVLSTKVDGCLLVVDAARTDARAARRAVERLTAVNATILGAVLNKVSAAHGYHGYDYYSSEQPADTSARPNTRALLDRGANNPGEVRVGERVE
jgi:capsular exopolysaccharide synthesis family protein